MKFYSRNTEILEIQKEKENVGGGHKYEKERYFRKKEMTLY